MNWETITQVQGMQLSEPQWLWLALALVVLVPLWKRLRPAVAHTYTDMHKIRAVGWPGVICICLLCANWLAFTVAMTRPQLATEEMRQSLNARDFVIGIDRSGSMNSSATDNAALRRKVDAFEAEERRQEEELRARFPGLYPYPLEAAPAKSSGTTVERFRLARYAAVEFLRSRPEGDRAAMFTFDDEVYWSWPLGSDIPIVLRKVSQLKKQSGGGTNFDGPNGPRGKKGAFQATIDHFESLGKAKTRVMIFISDGDAGISPQRHQQLVEQMKKEGQEIHIFALVCAGKEALANSNTASMRKLIEAVNPADWRDSKGEAVDAVLWAGDGASMQKAFERISELEKSTIDLEPQEVNRDVTHYFILLGCLLSALFIGACAVFRENL